MLKRRRNQDKYIPRNPHKYKGGWPIIVRSQWEKKFCQWLDYNKAVIEWRSESDVVHYYDPVMCKMRRYYPDFFMKVKTKTNGTKKYLIELKPYHETRLPKRTNRKSKKTMLYQEATYLTNRAKWKAAKEYCRKMGYNWKILTERELFKNGNS